MTGATQRCGSCTFPVKSDDLPPGPFAKTRVVCERCDGQEGIDTDGAAVVPRADGGQRL